MNSRLLAELSRLFAAECNNDEIEDMEEFVRLFDIACELQKKAKDKFQEERLHGLLKGRP